MTPLNDPLYHIVYCADARGIDTVMIDGKIVFNQGRFSCLPLEEILTEAGAMLAELHQRNAGLYALAENIDRYL